MDNPDAVRVAVIVRPLVTPELLAGCSHCIKLTPGEPKVQIGSNSFTFDYVYGDTTESTSNRIFDDCVAPLVDALFHGYNATVLAYGQTGSGKTYTMGSNYIRESTNGIIPKVMQTIFRQVEKAKLNTEYLLKVSFIEIFKKEVFDLLESNSAKGDGNGKGTGPSRAPIQIRETANGGISLAGVTEAKVTSQEEMESFLLRGSLCRATGSTDMNSQSSRSHAIFTITMEQKRISGVTSGGGHDDVGDDILSAKLHLVDLAGSERAKKTGADEIRFQEGIHINNGLLALGNVISALGDDKKHKEGGHVPYRDSKLTRLLQDSLGGNSKTVMIACVSPADINAEETVNTLKYANRARSIQNKAIVNRDLVTPQVKMMKNQTEQLQAELLNVKRDSSTQELQILEKKIAVLETSNIDLQTQLQEHQVNAEYLTKQATDAQKQKIVVLERSITDLQMQLQEHQVNTEYLTKQATDAQKQKIALLERSNADLQMQLQENQVNFEYLTNAQKQKIAVLERSNADLQTQLQEHHVNVEYLTKQATAAQKQKIAVLERSNADLQTQLQEHLEYLSNQATDAQKQKIAMLERSNTDLQMRLLEHQVNDEYLTKQATNAQKQKIALLERSNADLQTQLQEHQVNVEYLIKQATNAQKQKIALLERSNADLQTQLQEHQVSVEYLIKQVTNAQKQKIALLERSNVDLQTQLQEHQVDVEHLTKQATEALKQRIALLETSNADLKTQLQEHQVNDEYLTKQATDDQKKKIALLERSNADLQTQLQEHQVNVDYLIKQADAQKQKIELLERSKADLQTQLEEHQVNVENLTEQATEAQKQKISLLERSNADLQKQLQEHLVNVEHLTKQAADAQFEKDKLLLKIDCARGGKPCDEADCDMNKDLNVLKRYESRIQELGDLPLHPKSCLFPESDSKTAEVVDYFEKKKELEHCSLREKPDNGLNELDIRFEQKEVLTVGSKDKGKKWKDGNNNKYKGKNMLERDILKNDKKNDESETSFKNGKRSRKQKDPSDAKMELLDREYPKMHSRVVPLSLFKAIRDAKVNMKLFLGSIGFGSLHGISVGYIPRRLGRLAVQKFNSKDFRMNLNQGSIEVNPEKVHDMFGVPVGGRSLLSLDEKPGWPNDPVTQEWFDQFNLEKKQIRVSHLADKIATATRVDFIFKLNFLMLFTNTLGKNETRKPDLSFDVLKRIRDDTQIQCIDWCGYIYNCLYDSKVPEGAGTFYNGPLLFLTLLYLDSTKFEPMPYVRSRPAIKDWNSTRMRNRTKLEIKQGVFGKLELQAEWTPEEAGVTDGETSIDDRFEDDVTDEEEAGDEEESGDEEKSSDEDAGDKDEDAKGSSGEGDGDDSGDKHDASEGVEDSSEDDSGDSSDGDGKDVKMTNVEECHGSNGVDIEVNTITEKELDKTLERKDAEMNRPAGGDASVFKQHHEKKVQDLEQEKKKLQKEIEQRRCNLANISSTSHDSIQGPRKSIAYYAGGNMSELLEDMDTSESEHSDLDAKKRNSKCSMENNTVTETHKTSLSKENTTKIQKSLSGTCCTCSKLSSCKTRKCECRVINDLCSVSCGCHTKKCINREPVLVETSDLKPTVTVGNVNSLDTKDIDKSSSELASQGAMLLQAALSDKPAEIDERSRKQKGPSETNMEELLDRKYPKMYSSVVPLSLFKAIRDAKVNMKLFLGSIGFGSLHGISMEDIPWRLCRLAVLKFNSKDFRMNLNQGSIKVNPEKVHDMFGVPVGGRSLLSLDEKPGWPNDPVTQEWFDQFNLEKQQIRVSHLADKIATATRVDLIFKLNFLMLFTNTLGKNESKNADLSFDVLKRIRDDTPIQCIDWCGYIYNCLYDSKLPEGPGSFYNGPLLFLTLLYLDSTKFEPMPYVRSRPAIKDWNSTLMKNRTELEIKQGVFGKLELQREWTPEEAGVTEGFFEVDEERDFTRLSYPS